MSVVLVVGLAVMWFGHAIWLSRVMNARGFPPAVDHGFAVDRPRGVAAGVDRGSIGPSCSGDVAPWQALDDFDDELKTLGVDWD